MNTTTVPETGTDNANQFLYVLRSEFEAMLYAARPYPCEGFPTIHIERMDNTHLRGNISWGIEVAIYVWSLTERKLV